MSDIAVNGPNPGVSPLKGGASPAADGASSLPKAPRQPESASTRATTGFSNTPAIAEPISANVAKLVARGAVAHPTTGLAQLPLRPRPLEEPRKDPRPAGPMTAARNLDTGLSPLAPLPMFTARSSFDLLGEVPNTGVDATSFWNSGLDALEAYLGDQA